MSLNQGVGKYIHSTDKPIMNIENAIAILQPLVFAKTGKYLDTLQLNILRGAWENQTYEEIAETYCFSLAHAKTVGANLWDLLSEVTDTKINKKNVQVVLERKLTELATDGVTDVTDELPVTSETIEKINNPSTVTSTVISVASVTSVTSVTTSAATAAPLSEAPGGIVTLDSPFYIPRPPIEQRCYDTIKQAGSLIRIQAPRQMGKTSLMARILDYSRQLGYVTVILNLQLASQNVFSNLERFLKWFCVIIGKNLGLPNQLAEYWDDILDSNASTTDYFENYLLAQIDTSIVIAVDDMDVLFSYPDIASDFLGLLRSWYEKAKYGDGNADIWKKLRLLVVNSTETILSLNLEQSPFNVGLLIELPEFTPSQVEDLVQRHRLDWEREEIEQLMNLVGGNPYLIGKALFHIQHQELTLEELLPQSATKGRVYGEHLRRKLWHLQNYPQLLTALITVANSLIPVELERVEAVKLHGMGLVKLRGKQAIPRCELYRQYFGQENISELAIRY